MPNRKACLTSVFAVVSLFLAPSSLEEEEEEEEEVPFDTVFDFLLAPLVAALLVSVTGAANALALRLAYARRITPTAVLREDFKSICAITARMIECFC